MTRSDTGRPSLLPPAVAGWMAMFAAHPDCVCRALGLGVAATSHEVMAAAWGVEVVSAEEGLVVAEAGADVPSSALFD